MTFVLGAKAESFAPQAQALSGGKLCMLKSKVKEPQKAVLFSWLPLTIEEK